MFSYSLKTIVMEMIRDDPANAWNERNLAENFLKALHNVEEKLHQQRVEYFFDSSSNLLAKMDANWFKSTSGWLTKVIRDLENSQNTPNCMTVWSKHFRI